MKKLFLLFGLLYSINGISQNFAFIELFTSEGDETSPLAEQILNRVSEEEKKKGNLIYVLEYHVDYWNRLGWKDPYSKYQFTIRQENYSRVLSEKELYTPQIVINGTKGFPGTREKTLREEIANGLNAEVKHSLSFTADSMMNDTLYLSYQSTAAGNNFVLRFAIKENTVNTKVTAGENTGKTLTHKNVVRILHSTDGVKASDAIRIPVKEFEKKNFTITGFIQSKQSMKIVAASESEKKN